MRKIAYEDARNLFLTACGYGARFRPVAKWFTHRTSLTWFADGAAGRSWRRGAAVEGVKTQQFAAKEFSCGSWFGLIR